MQSPLFRQDSDSDWGILKKLGLRHQLWVRIRTTGTSTLHPTTTIFKKKEKERKSIYITPFIYYVYLKTLRHGSHSFTCKYAMPAFPS